MATIATICARAGSRGVPGKNTRMLHGKPLIAHSIEHALQCPAIDGVYVSTDSEHIADVARAAGATVLGLRPPELATSDAPKLPVIRHLVDSVIASGVTVDRIVDLDPTSPLRDAGDIMACLDLLDEDTDLVITGYEADKNPYFNMVETKDDGTVRTVKSVGSDVVARQHAPSVYAMNGSVYVWWERTLTDSLWDGNVRIHVMPRERSIDVDDEIDWMMVELLMARKRAAQA